MEKNDQEDSPAAAAPPPPAVIFTGHHSYIVTVAKACRESERFTDVNIVCQDGSIAAHRYMHVTVMTHDIVTHLSALVISIVSRLSDSFWRPAPTFCATSSSPFPRDCQSSR